MNKLVELLDEFKDKNIFVIGDMILDKYVYGEVERISPEAPIPILRATKEDYTLGGAANDAENILELGGNVFIGGVIGNDQAGNTLVSNFPTSTSLEGLIQDPRYQTLEKSRIISREQQLLRIDYEKLEAIPKIIEEKLIQIISKNLEDVDAVLVSDYGKGLVTKKLMENLVKSCNNLNKPIVVDPKPINRALYRGVSLIIPNKDEALGMASGLISYNNLSEVGNGLVDYIKGNILITRGKEGMSLFETGKKQIDIATVAKEVYDVTGAGDTVASVMTLGIASNATLYDSALIANVAAGIAVSKFGAYAVRFDELKNAILNL